MKRRKVKIYLPVFFMCFTLPWAHAETLKNEFGITDISQNARNVEIAGPVESSQQWGDSTPRHATVTVAKSVSNEKKQVSKNIKPLRVPNDPPIIYPFEARREGQEGRVLLAIKVAASGQVEQVKVARSSGYPILDQAARQGVERWVFDTGLDTNYVFLPVTFELNAPRVS